MQKFESEKNNIEKIGVFLLNPEQVPTYLYCNFCNQILLDPCELLCGHAIACKSCLDSKGICKKCVKFVEYKEAVIAKRIINELKAKCAFNCGFESSFAEVRIHAIKCLERECVCSVPKCAFKGKKVAFLQHVKEVHQKKLIETFQKTSDEAIESIIEDKVNSRGFLAKIGETGKYYCEHPLDKITCSCCDGNCGPTNGCNCSACMKLDIEARKLPEGFLVNRGGAIAQLQPGINKYICGRKTSSWLSSRCTATSMCVDCAKLNATISRYTYS